MSRLIQRLQDYKHFVLLLALLAMSLMQVVAHGLVRGLVIYDVLLTLMLLGIFYVVFGRRKERLWALFLGCPAVVSQWAAYCVGDEYQLQLAVVHHGSILIFFSYAVAVILQGIFKEEVITADHVIGTVCGYILAGVAFGNAYLLAELLMPGAFSIKQEISWLLDDEHGRAFLFNYFSLSTLTGTGLGDVTPIRPGVASLTWLESMFGQFYFAVVVAQLVGLKMAQAMEKSKFR